MRIGETAVFWVTAMDSMTPVTVTATLRHASNHLYMYVDNRLAVAEDDLRRSADVFEGQTYPTTRRYFGDAWGPGLDGDERISVLHTEGLGAAGVFSTADEESTLGNPFSNGRHMIYINARALPPGTPAYHATLAHEFQHAVHFFHDRREDAWVNEGMSVLNEMLNGYESAKLGLASFARFPGTQLTTWGDDPDRSAHYGAAFAFLSYFHQRFGDQALLWLIEDNAQGAAGIDNTLRRLGHSERFDDVFADWMVANAINDPAVAAGRYSYGDLNLRLTPTSRVSVPAGPQAAVTQQYAAYYVELSPSSSASTLQFAGATQAALVGNAAHSGSHQWWGNRGDLIDATLTRAFDLTQVRSATLTFWTWFDLENGWDYAYVSASADGGKTWQTLPTMYTTIANPVGNNLGYGYTGVSGGGKRAEWVNDQASLSQFAGHHVLVRFEYVTDDAVTGSGFCVDDVAIAEIGFSDDSESERGWDAQGFVRTTNTIEQPWQLRLITLGKETTVAAVPVDAFGQAQATLPAGRRYLLAIAATAPVTTEPAVFTYTATAGVLAQQEPAPAGVALAR